MNSNAWNHFRTITKHKFVVMVHCFKIGLIKQGLLHDLSKYSPSEFKIGVQYYQGTRSPNNAEREETGVSTAWLHHKGRNKHHFEYWIDYGLHGPKLEGMKMPKKYVLEMFCDRVAASKIYMGKDYNQKAPLEYYEKGRVYLLMHEDTAALLERLLRMLAEKGERKTFSYIRKVLMKTDEYENGMPECRHIDE